MMKWYAMWYDFNRNTIEPYNVLECREDMIKKLKKKCATKEEFLYEMKREMMYEFWSRAEYELIISLEDDGRVILSPWIGSRNGCKMDVTDAVDFDWVSFAEKHIKAQIYKNEAKIDIWDQLSFGDKWNSFIDYCWYYHHKYQRNDPKFGRATL